MLLLASFSACPLLSSFAVTDLALNKPGYGSDNSRFAGLGRADSAFRFRSRHTIALESIAQIFFFFRRQELIR